MCALAGLGGLYGLLQYRGWLGDFVLSTPAAIGFVLSFLVGTFLVTPDLDLAESKVRAKNRWGILGHLWVPYGHIFSHRGMSHSWVFGPTSRLIYMVILGTLAWMAMRAISDALGYSVFVWRRAAPDDLQIAGACILAFFLSQWLHLAADGVGPAHGWRRMYNKLKR